MKTFLTICAVCAGFAFIAPSASQAGCGRVGIGFSVGFPFGYGGYYGGSAAADGLWLGALAGGIVGHNRGFSHGRNGWRGAAWGAGAGWLLGSLIDSNRYYNTGYDYDYGYGYPRTVVMPQAQPVVVQTAQPAAAPQQITIINNYYGNAAPMASANAMFGR